MRISLVCSAALAASLAFGADDAAPRLVTLNFGAIDAQGHAVTDLAAADIQVTDQGKSVPVVAFRNEALRSAPAGREFSNRPAPAVSQIHVILFDILNLGLNARQSAVDQVVRTVENIANGDSFYFYVLNLYGDLVPVRGLPDAPPAAGAAAAPWTRNIRAMLDQATGSAASIHVPIEQDVVKRVQRTYAAMETLAGRMAPLPGRKSILWTTFGIPCSLPTENGTTWDCRPNLSKVAARLDQANVEVDPVVLQIGADDIETNSTFQQFVDLTGGKLYAGDIEHAVSAAMDAGHASYRLQYAPAANNWDVKTHKVRLTTTRKGVTLLVKQSYMAEKGTPASGGKERNAALIASPFDASDIGLNVAASAGAQPHSLHLRIGIDVQDLLLIPRGDHFAGQLVFSVVAYLPDNKVQNYDPLPVNLNLTAEQRDKMSRDGMHLGHDVTLPEAARRVRLLVEDKLANVAATVTIPVQ